MNGSPGGHAGAASPGQSGGSVVVSLHELGVALARVRGLRRLPDGSQEAIDAHVELGDAGFVDLLARGGAGGRGGDGGRGGAGATGHRGRDATRYSSGGNGGEGGDGGRGGNATSGADGGPGGSVIARVDDADTHLLMLVRAGVEGGAGGGPGAHGGGGAGGPGGAGGSSHSWTERETYRDSNGKTQTRTTHHRNSGGSSGPSGRSGQSGSGPLFSGRNGADGAFAIEVVSGDSVHRYPARYHLMLTAIRLSTDDRDDVFEPGEIVRVDGLRVRNVGHMPTPSTRAITIEARDSRWCSTLEDERLEVPRSVPAGVEVEVPGTISFELRDHAPTDPDDPLIASERVTLRAHVPDVNRSFEGFEPDVLTLAATMKVRFPIAASVLEGLSALAPGEVTRLRFAVRNQSKKALGARSEGRRRVRARLSLFESELGDESVALIDEHGKRAPLAGEGLVRELELLEAGADWIFEGALAMREGAPAYRELRLRLTLEIGRLDMPDVLRVVQHRELRVRCVRPLAPSARMDWLLVANHRTAREEIDAWEALARDMQRTLVVWDVSLQGHLALEAPRDDGAPVLERLGGGLVVVLGYPMDTAYGELRAHELLAPATLARAAEERVDVLLAGGGAPSLDALLAPEMTGDETAPADGERALLARIERHATQSDQAFVERAEIFEIGFAFEDASRVRLESRAKALAEELATRFPQRRCVVVWDFAPEPRSSWLLVKRSRVGTIRVLARPAARNAVASLAIDDLQLSSPEFVRSDACRIALAVASGPDDQVEALVRALEAGDVAGSRVWADALLVGLASEQLAMLRRTRWGADLSLDRMRAQLPRLERLSRASLLGAHAPSSEVGELIASLAARLLFYADSQARLWEKIPPLSFFRRAPGLDVITEQLVRELVSTQSSDDEARRVLRDRIVVAQRALRAEWKAANPGMWSVLDRAEWARNRVLAPVAGENLTTDDELLVSDAGTAIELPDWRALRSRAKAGEQLREEVVATLATQRSELLLSIRAAELLGERAPIAARVEASHGELASADHAADQARERTHAP